MRRRQHRLQSVGFSPRVIRNPRTEFCATKSSNVISRGARELSYLSSENVSVVQPNHRAARLIWDGRIEEEIGNDFRIA